MTDDKDDLIRQLTIRLRETVDENDKLRAELARLTEGATAHATLQDIYRNRDLPATTRAKAAAASLPHELPRLESVPPPLELVAEVIEPLATVVERQRARANRILALPLASRSAMISGTGGSSDGNDDASDV